uniref:TSA: Wollemia nobilis Ref_Wollemi_Transcript_8391_1977 transcribed RNA sequence n=1 Tax=Wollemia nobilis TaxID=56998 RepID=A0A0C9RNG6_9CONI
MALTCILSPSLSTWSSRPTFPKSPSFPLQRNSSWRIRPITCKKKKKEEVQGSNPVRAAYVPMKPLKARLAEGEKLYGIFLLSFSPVVAEIAGYAGYDYAVVDMEHGPGDFMAALPVLHALAATGTPAIIRIPDNDPALAKKAMDLGPQGIMFPMIDSPKDARKAVSYCRYPPKGIRGASHPAVRASRYGINLNYLEEYEDEVLVMCQVESEEAVKKIEEIASVEGVDCIQMGPTDLGASMGFLADLGNRKAKEMRMRAEKGVLGLKNGAFLAGFALPCDPPDELQRRGYQMMTGAVDTPLIRDAALADIKKYKEGWVGVRVEPADVGPEVEEEAEKEYA